MAAPNFTRDHYLDLAVSNLATQFDDATHLRALLRGIAGLMWDEIVQPLAFRIRWPDPSGVSGRSLDDLGTCLGLSRPRLSDGTYFGFDGTADDGGETFGQAPMFSARGNLENSLPVGDAMMRLLLAWRALSLTGSPTYEEIGRLYRDSFPAMTVSYDSTDSEVDVEFNDPASGVPELGAGVFDELQDTGSVFPEKTGIDYNYS